MNWIEITELQELDTIKKESFSKPQLIFKHSTRCSISSMVKNRLEKGEVQNEVDFYLLDLIKHRDISNEIAETFHVHHESPQALLIKNGECTFSESHYDIRFDEIIEQAAFNS
jgi:bacillithiol system protein YtxJ